MDSKSLFWPTFIIFFVIIIGQVSTDLYLPSMPSMAAEWHVDPKLIQITVGAFLLGYSIPQVIYGPFADRFGRKPLLLYGLTLYSLATIGCALAPSPHFIISMRVLQGLGGGACSICWRAIMRDVYSGKRLARVANYSSMVWSFVPIIAPVCGGYIQHYLGWRFNFVVLLIFSVIALLVALFLYCETMDASHRQSIHIKSIFKNYGLVLSKPAFLGYSFSASATYMVMVTFNVAAPFILQNQLNLTPVTYGWTIILVSIGYLAGASTNHFLVTRFTGKQLIWFGLGIMFVAALTMWGYAFAHVMTLAVIIAPMFFLFFASGIIFPNAMANVLMIFPKLSGSAGALYGLVVIAMGGLVSIFVAHLHEQTQLPMATVILGMVLAAILGFMLLIQMPKSESI